MLLRRDRGISEVNLPGLTRAPSNVRYTMFQPEPRTDPGAFADPTFPEPWFSVWEERRHPWVRIETEGPIERMN